MGTGFCCVVAPATPSGHSRCYAATMPVREPIGEVTAEAGIVEAALRRAWSGDRGGFRRA